MVNQIIPIALIALSALTGIRARDNLQATNNMIYNLPFPAHPNILFTGPSNTPADLLQDIVAWINRSDMLVSNLQRGMYIVINIGITVPEPQDVSNLLIEL